MSGKEYKKVPLTELEPSLDSDKPLVTQKGSAEYGSMKQYSQPDNYLKMSFLALICFCPCGIVAVTSALKVNRIFRSGHAERAIEESEKALLYSTYSFRVAFFTFTITLLIVACCILFGLFWSFDYNTLRTKD